MDIEERVDQQFSSLSEVRVLIRFDHVGFVPAKYRQHWPLWSSGWLWHVFDVDWVVPPYCLLIMAQYIHSTIAYKINLGI